jgi:hypothetical protein
MRRVTRSTRIARCGQGASEGAEAFTGLYHQWRDRAAKCCTAPAALGQSTTLTAAQRAEVRAVFAEASGLRKRVSPNGIMGGNPVAAVRLSLAQLLLDDPGLAARYPHEVAAANPAGGDRRHRMLGPPRRVQGGTMGADDTFVLLQLECDTLGPRFEW